MSKKSIRFFNDREVRAVWDDENNKWWFSATDIVRAINNEDDYVKAGNYWRWLKKKLNTEGVQLVSATHDFKFQAPDGKQRAADALDAECVQTLAKHYPNNRAHAFLDWFTYSDNTIDGQSQKKAYTLFESGLMETLILLERWNFTVILVFWYTLRKNTSEPIAHFYLTGVMIGCPFGMIGTLFTTARLKVQHLPLGVTR